MFLCNLWTHILDNNQGTTYPTTIACYIHSLVVVINVDPNKFIDLSGSSELAERSNKATRESGKTDDKSIQMNNKGGWTVYLCTSRESNV
jgi:hypothetical protein